MPMQRQLSDFMVTSDGQLLIDGENLLRKFAGWEIAEQTKAGWRQIGHFTDLTLAWRIPLEWSGDVRFVWRLLCEDRTILPLYLCPDDLDFSCIVIVVEVEKTEDFVYWKRVGYVTHTGEDFQKEKESGILDVDVYTNEDWERFGDNIALENADSPEWYRWINENWNEELYRRRMNYTLPYYRDGGGVCWVQTVDYTFERNGYVAELQHFRDIQLEMEIARVFQMSDKVFMDKNQCADMLAALSPDGYEVRNGHLLDYGEVLLHVFSSEQITEPLINYLRLVVEQRTIKSLQNQPEQDVERKIKIYSKAIELMWAKGTAEVVNVVDVSILERLSDDGKLWQEFGTYLSEDFKTYINQVLIPQNVMMSENARLQ